MANINEIYSDWDRFQHDTIKTERAKDLRLMEKYNVEMSKLRNLDEKYTTNDGCTHYIHEDGRHFRYDFAFKQDWFME